MSVDILRNLPENGRFKLPDDKCETLPELEISFSVRLFPEGFSIGKPLEKERSPPPAHEAMEFLYPYNRASEGFLRALDGGWIPADLLEDIPCKYVNGCVACEVLDYCVNAGPSGDTNSVLSPKLSADAVPAVYKVILKPTTESIVKDITSMVDETWTYKNLMEAESKVLRTTWPELHLDPKSTANNVEKKPMLQCSQSIFKYLKNKRGSLLNRRWYSTVLAKAMVKTGCLASSKNSFETASAKMAVACVETPVIGADAGKAVHLKPNMLGSMASPVQFPVSLNANMGGSPGWHDQPALVEKQSVLGKRDSREYEAKLDVKKLKQDSPKLEIHAENREQFSKSVSREELLEHIKVEMQMNADQQKLDDLRTRDDRSGITVEGGRHNDSQIQSQHQSQLENDQHSWQVLSSLESKQDDSLHRKKIDGMQQKPDGRPFMQSYDLSSSGLSQNVAAVGGTTHSKDSLQASVSITAGLPVEAMQQIAKRRATPVSRPATNVAGVASPGNTVNSVGVASISSPAPANVSSITVKSEGLMVPGPMKEPIDNFMQLISVAQRNGLRPRRRKVDLPPPPSDDQKASPSWQLLLVALANTSNDDIRDPKGQRNMADSLVGGVNVRKTRFLQFQRSIQQAPGTHYRRVRIRLVMCERGKDAMVEAVVQFGDDQDDETLNSVPHHVLPTMANAHAADIFAKQFCALLEKEGFELVDDQVQPTMPRGNMTTNAAAAARPLSAGASALGGSLSSPRSSLMNQQMPGMALGMPGLASMQASSPNGLPTTQMLPPRGNVANRQISASFLGQSVVNNTSKAMHLDGSTAQLAAVQQQQQHQAHLQRAQPMVLPSQLTQLNHNPAQQLNQQMLTANPGQIQQLLQQQQQQRHQTQVLQQRKLMSMGSLGPISNLGGVGIPVGGSGQGGMGNMVGVNALNNVVGMPGINNVSAAMSTISNLNNVGQLQGMVAMGQAGLSNLIGRPGSLTPAQMAAFSSKARLPVSGANQSVRDNLTGLTSTNQLHASAALNQTMNRVGRVGLTAVPQAGPVGSLGSPRVATSNMPSMTGQSMYVNSSQQIGSQQQFSLQQLSPHQQTGQQPINAQQVQLTQSQQTSMQVQQQNSSPSLNLPQQKNNIQPIINAQTTLHSQQQLQQQQSSTHSQISASSQQHGSMGNLGSLVVGPASPSQNAGSVTSGTGMDASVTNCNGSSLSSS